MKNILLMIAQICKETTTTTRMTNLNVHIVFALLEKRIMVWVVTISSTKSEAVDSDIYINECLEQRMPPFICEHHSDSNYYFWPDLAGCHYSKQTVAWMDENEFCAQRD